MSKVWKILQVSSRLLVFQDIISISATTTETTASDAKLANDARLSERKFRNFERCQKTGETSKLAEDCLYFRTSSPPPPPPPPPLHLMPRYPTMLIFLRENSKIREMSKVWKILQVSSRMLVFQDIISISATTTTASDAKLANDAWLPEKKFRNFERCRKTGETSKLAADCL